MWKKWIIAIVFAAALLPGVCFAETLKPLPGGPDTRKLEWSVSDEFCRKEIRDGKTFLVVDVPRGKEAGMHVFQAKIDVEKFKDQWVSFLVRYRIKDVSEPPKRYLGSKFMLSYTDGNTNVGRMRICRREVAATGEMGLLGKALLPPPQMGNCSWDFRTFPAGSNLICPRWKSASRFLLKSG